MKSIKTDKVVEIKYPILKESIHSGIVVMFTSLNHGFVVVRGKKIFPLGHFSDSWYEDIGFRPYTGTITLEN
tara:strand:+ start:375 stop:590 length:216 start_codon:yes stop_codon:yes gene_type:complete